MKHSQKQIKVLAGKTLIQICNQIPTAKRAFKHLGLRTSKEWFGTQIVQAQLPAGKNLRLASVSENYLSFELFWKGTSYYEPITTLLLQELLRPGDTFLDIGANIGFYSLVLSKAQPELTVISFEPNPRLYELLRQNIAVNQLKQVTCEPVALSDTDGTARLFLNKSDMSASLRDDFDANLTDSVEVATTRLDSYLDRHELRRRLVVKVDVEGHEEAFLEGARQTLAFRKPDLITEVAVNYGSGAMSLLKDNGYRFYPITDQGLNETETLTPVVREPFVFLNYLLSTKSPPEVRAVFSRIEERVRKIDLTQTSKHADFHALQQMKARQNHTGKGGEPAFSFGAGAAK